MSQHKTCILILGMHRSGTSALTGFFDILGFNTGKILMPKAESNNAKGFFENQKVNDLNEAILKELNSTWYSLELFDLNWHLNSNLQNFYEKAKKIISDDYSKNNIFVIKDPRISILFPFWERVLQSLNIAIKTILPYRNPIEIAKSLEKRDNFSIELSLFLWLKYILSAEFYTRKYDRVFTTYDELIEDPIKFHSKIISFLDLEETTLSVQVKEKLNVFLDASLRHHKQNPFTNTTSLDLINKSNKIFFQASQNNFEKTFTKELNNLFGEYKLLNSLLNRTYNPYYKDNFSNLDLIEVKLEKDELLNYQPFQERENKNKVAIIIHLYYIDLWHEIKKHLDLLDLEFNIYVTLPQFYNKVTHYQLLQQLGKNARLIITENRGRDVLPFLKILTFLDLNNYKYICKIHTKKSLYQDNGEIWRKFLYSDLIGSNEIVNQIINTFETNDKIGVITAKDSLLSAKEFMSENRDKIKQIARLTNINYTNDFSFAAGTMFWINTDVLKSLTPILTKLPIFEKEEGQINNTLAHGFERFFGLLCKKLNFQIIETTPIHTKKYIKLLEHVREFTFQNIYNWFQYEKLIDDKQKEVESVNQQLNSSKKSITLLQSEVNNRAQVIEDKIAIINQKDLLIFEKINKINEYNNTLKLKNDSIDTLQNEVKNRGSIIKEKNQKILLLSNTIQEKQLQEKKYETRLASKEQSIQLLQEEINNRGNIIKKQKSDINKLTETLHLKTSTITQLKSSINKYRDIDIYNKETISDLTKEIDMLKNELTHIYTSKSWKLTKPLRLLKRLIK